MYFLINSGCSLTASEMEQKIHTIDLGTENTWKNNSWLWEAHKQWSRIERDSFAKNTQETHKTLRKVSSRLTSPQHWVFDDSIYVKKVGRRDIKRKKSRARKRGFSVLTGGQRPRGKRLSRNQNNTFIIPPLPVPVLATIVELFCCSITKYCN